MVLLRKSAAGSCHSFLELRSTGQHAGIYSRLGQCADGKYSDSVVPFHFPRSIFGEGKSPASFKYQECSGFEATASGRPEKGAERERNFCALQRERSFTCALSLS